MTSDIPGTGRDVLLRDGWHAVEHFAGETFRWARNDARLIVPAFEPGSKYLEFEVEVGPGVSKRPTRFTVYDLDDVAIFDTHVEHRARVSLILQSASSTVHALRLNVADGGNASGFDRRILDYRLLWVALNAL